MAKVIFENADYFVEVHPFAVRPFWVISKEFENPLRPEEAFYDKERTIEHCKFLSDFYQKKKEKKQNENNGKTH